jgi:hypothetical protein
MAVKSYTNIKSVTLTPEIASPELFTGALRALGDRPFLSRLSVNCICIDEISTPILATITGLRELELSDPTQIILDLLPEWLSRLSKTLVALHLTVSLKSFIITTQ